MRRASRRRSRVLISLDLLSRGVVSLASSTTAEVATRRVRLASEEELLRDMSTNF